VIGDRLAEMFDVLPERVSRFRVSDLRIVYCNRAWAAGHDTTPADVVGQRLDQLLSPDELVGLAAQLARLSPETPILTDVTPRPAPDAPDRWISWADRYISGPDGDEIISVGRDVTSQHLSDLALASSEARFHDLADRSPDIILHLVLEPQPHVEYASPSLETITGISPAEIMADMGVLATALLPESRPEFLTTGSERVPPRFDVQLRRPDGAVVVVEMQLTAVPGGVQGVGRDVTEIRALQSELVALAMRDPLTGLANRRLLDELLRQALHRTERSGDEIQAAFLDLDGFKIINDTYGHDAGDTVLRETARRLLANVREADVVARVGGDEFVVVAESRSVTSDSLVDRINEALAPPIELSPGVSVICLASIGEADTSKVGRDPAGLIAAADAAMYEVKKARSSPQDFHSVA
jgi:diguanylate cyclase (GGDEF)-like protein/PAS domain S-box-containing protein